jgi:hypothetical protein
LTAILEKCSSFLQVRDGVVSFVHHSAKDYVGRHILDHSTISHSTLTQRCLDYLGSKLEGNAIRLIRDPRRDGPAPKDPLAEHHYASHHWMIHLSEIPDVTQDTDACEKVHVFLAEHFLHWVEHLTLQGQLKNAVVRLRRLDLRLQQNIVSFNPP